MEFLYELAREKQLPREFVRPLGSVAYHAPCHLRHQKIGFRAPRPAEAGGRRGDADRRLLRRRRHLGHAGALPRRLDGRGGRDAAPHRGVGRAARRHRLPALRAAHRGGQRPARRCTRSCCCATPTAWGPSEAAAPRGDRRPRGLRRRARRLPARADRPQTHPAHGGGRAGDAALRGSRDAALPGSGDAAGRAHRGAFAGAARARRLQRADARGARALGHALRRDRGAGADPRRARPPDRHRRARGAGAGRRRGRAPDPRALRPQANGGGAHRGGAVHPLRARPARRRAPGRRARARVGRDRPPELRAHGGAAGAAAPQPGGGPARRSRAAAARGGAARAARRPGALRGRRAARGRARRRPAGAVGGAGRSAERGGVAGGGHRPRRRAGAGAAPGPPPR